MLLGMGHFRVAPRLCFKLRLSAKPWIWRFNNYWMRLSKILWFVSRRLRQIIDLWDTDKSRYFAITELNNNFFIVLSFSHRVCFLMDIFRKRSDFCHFHARVIARRRKAWLPLCMSRKIIICSQTKLDHIAHEQTIIVGSFLQPCGGILANERKENLQGMIIFFIFMQMKLTFTRFFT